MGQNTLFLLGSALPRLCPVPLSSPLHCEQVFLGRCRVYGRPEGAEGDSAGRRRATACPSVGRQQEVVWWTATYSHDPHLNQRWGWGWQDGCGDGSDWRQMDAL